MAYHRNQLTCSVLFNFFRRNCKDSKHLYHNLYYYVPHSRCRGNLDIRLKPLKEALDPIEDVNKRIFASTNALNCLRNWMLQSLLPVAMGDSRIKHTESKTPIPVNIIPAGGYTCRTDVRSANLTACHRYLEPTVAYLTNIRANGQRIHVEYLHRRI